MVAVAGSMLAIRAAWKGALARVRQQRAESFGLVALDALLRPVEPGHVILERGSHRSQVRCAQPLIRRLRIIAGHASSYGNRSPATSGWLDHALDVTGCYGSDADQIFRKRTHWTE